MINDVTDRRAIDRQMSSTDVLAANALADGVQGLIPAVGDDNSIFRTFNVQDILSRKYVVITPIIGKYAVYYSLQQCA